METWIQHITQSKKISEEKHRQARIQFGLQKFEDDIRDYSHIPSLAYIDDPNHKVIKEIHNEFQNEKMEVESKFGKNNHKDDVTRWKRELNIWKNV